MTAGPTHRHVAVDPSGDHAARWATGLAAAVVVVLVVAYTVFAIAYAVGGSDGVEDTWVGMLGAVALLGGLATSLVAFVLAALARTRHARGTWLWLPLTVFPVLLAAVALGEAFLFE